jgi:hypothetical protein
MTRRPVNTGEIQRAAVKTARKQRAVAKKEPTLPAPDDLDIAAIAQAKARNEARPRRVKLNAKMSDTDQATVKRMELRPLHIFSRFNFNRLAEKVFKQRDEHSAPAALVPDLFFKLGRRHCQP